MPVPASLPAKQFTEVWDGPVRIVHWALVALIGFSWYSAETGRMDLHRYAGYGVLALLVFRVLWGFVGSSTARFSGFVRGPGAVGRYLRSLPKRTTGGDIGHNPVGALSVLALLLVMIVQVVTGLFAVDVDGIESGPLSDRVSFDQGRQLADLHHASFTALQVLVVLHVVAIAFYLFYKRDNLLGPMITGRRGDRDAADMIRAPFVNLLLAMAVAALVAWAVARGLDF